MRRTAALTVLFTAALSVATMWSPRSEGQSTTQPATPPTLGGSAGGIDQQAMKAMASKDYATALGLLRRMADLYKDDPRRTKAINEQIAECEKALASGSSGATPEERKVHPAPKEGETLVFDSIKDLGNFEYDADKGGGIPADVKALSGHPVKLHGFMIPMDQAENITTFALVPSLFGCCFGQPPQVQHTVVVHTPKGKAVSYFPDEIVVEGKLKVDEKKEDGFIVSIFEVTVTSVKPATP
jgi:hypothetical protein